MNIPDIVAHAKVDPTFTMQLLAEIRHIPVMGPWNTNGPVWTRTSVNGDSFRGTTTQRVEFYVLWDAGAPHSAVIRVNHRTDVALPDDVTWDLDTVTAGVAQVVEGEKAKVDAQLRAAGWLLL